MRVDPKKELFFWGPIEMRLFYGSFFIEAMWLKLKKYYHWFWPAFVGLWERGRFTFICEEKPLRATGVKYFKYYFFNQKNYQKHWQWWEEWVAAYHKLEARFEATNFAKFTDKELAKAIKEFYDFNILFWLIVHVPEIANWGGEKILKQKLQAIDATRANEYLEILSAPVKFSFFQQEELDLLRTHDFVEHAKNYRWLLNSYGGNQILTTVFFKKKRVELLKQKSASALIQAIEHQRKQNISRKQQLARRLQLSKEIILMADQLAQSIWWQDLRKGYIWRMHFWWDKFLHEVARRRGWKFEDLLWCWSKEVLAIAQGRIVNRKKIIARQTEYAQYFDGKSVQQEFYGARAKKLFVRYTTKHDDEIRELKGLVVSRGSVKFVRGRVKIIRNPFTDLHKMKPGDILVASMTSPEFIVAMKKASAIITDTGGMTSHAAIVSRELGIPCLVGTKLATKVFQDEDKVEFNIAESSIKKL